MWKEDHLLICEHCFYAIKGRGEQIIKLESLFYSEDYDEEALLTCESNIRANLYS